MSIIDIFNGYQSGSDNVLIKPRAVYVNADDGYVRDVDDVRALEFFFSVSSLQGISENNAVPLGYNNTIKYGYECLQMVAHQQITDRSFVIIVHESDRDFYTLFQMNYTGDLPEFDPGENPPKK